MVSSRLSTALIDPKSLDPRLGTIYIYIDQDYFDESDRNVLIAGSTDGLDIFGANQTFNKAHDLPKLDEEDTDYLVIVSRALSGIH